MRKIFTLLIVAILATATSWAATNTYQHVFESKPSTGNNVMLSNVGWNISGTSIGAFNNNYKGVQLGSSSKNGQITLTSPTGWNYKGATVIKEVRLWLNLGGKSVTPTVTIGGKVAASTGKVIKNSDASDWTKTSKVTFKPATDGQTGVIKISISSVKAGYICALEIDTEDNSGKTPTKLSWSSETATVDLASDAKVFPTLTKDPESLTGITYSSSNTNVATIDESTGKITLASCGSTTITAKYAGDDTYASSEASYTLNVTSSTAAAGEYTIALNNGFWGTNYNGQFSIKAGEQLALNGQQNGVNISLVNGTSTYGYISDEETRAYNGYKMTFNAPEGYVLKKIVFTSSGKWDKTTTATPGTMKDKIWTGEANSVEFSFKGTCAMQNVKVTYGKPETPKTLQSIAISGEPAKTEYTEGDAFNPEGLVVTATYDDASTAVVTDDATWSFEPATLAASTTSVTATATYNEKTASETYNVTVKEIPTYTYTWMVNGAEVKKSVLKAGAAVEAPANPENIDGKVFTGWVTTATVDANKKPEYATIDATAKANTTYYAVFATLKQGAGEKWIKKAAYEITEEGVYALISKDGKAFNGEISGSYKGDGQSTETAFEFVNNEATSAPKGTCELTFEKSEKAGTDGNEGYNMINKATGKFLTSMDNSQGNLTWSVLEDSYWYNNNGWIFKKNDTHLRVFFNSENIPTFRTYGNNNGDVLYFAQKVAGAGYADFTTIVKAAEVTTLANLAVNGAEGTAYQVNDEMVVAKKFQKAGKNYIVVKDAAKAVRNFSTPTADDKFFNINGNKQEEYAQNNWMLVSLPVELYNQLYEKSTVTSITGTLDEKLNVAMTATNVVAGEAADFAPNTYCPINFMGESSVKGNNTAYTSSYYFATPKANEYANVVWAVYNGTDGAFYLPSNNGSINVQEFKAAFKVDYSLNSVDNPKLTSGNVYSFEALVKEVAVPTTDAKSAPRKTAYDSTVAPSTKFVVYPLDLDDKKVATGVNDVNSAKEVKGVSYFNMMGVESAQPFEGVNIMVTTYTDGTSSAAKVLR